MNLRWPHNLVGNKNNSVCISILLNHGRESSVTRMIEPLQYCYEWGLRLALDLFKPSLTKHLDIISLIPVLENSNLSIQCQPDCGKQHN